MSGTKMEGSEKLKNFSFRCGPVTLKIAGKEEFVAWKKIANYKISKTVYALKVKNKKFQKNVECCYTECRGARPIPSHPAVG